jgi:RHS repeat-associated protein
VVERFAEDPYGKVTFYDASWNPLTGSAFAWQYTHQGLRFEALIGLFDNRVRWYSPTLMQFVSNDPIGLDASTTNLYRYEGNAPTGTSDPFGLQLVETQQEAAPNAGQSLESRNQFGEWIFVQNNFRESFTTWSQVKIVGAFAVGGATGFAAAGAKYAGLKGAIIGGVGGGLGGAIVGAIFSVKKQWRSAVSITFKPYRERVCCTEIAFVQIIDSGGGWEIDMAKTDTTTQAGAWYSYMKDGTTPYVTPGSSPNPYKYAVMTDTPYASLTNITWKFETCAICKAGADVGKVYGCITWGLDVDDNYWVSAHAPNLKDNPSPAFLAMKKRAGI